MKKFIFITGGFEPPTPEIMQAWGKWFESFADKLVKGGACHFGAGREINKDGVKDLPLGLDSLMGYTVIEVENMYEAEKIARDCPIITNIRIYEAKYMDAKKT